MRTFSRCSSSFFLLPFSNYSLSKFWSRSSSVVACRTSQFPHPAAVGDFDELCVFAILAWLQEYMRVEANPGKLLRLWVRSPFGLIGPGDRSLFAMRGAILFEGFANELIDLIWLPNANPSTFLSASLVKSATRIMTGSYPNVHSNSTAFRDIFSHPDHRYTILFL